VQFRVVGEDKEVIRGDRARGGRGDARQPWTREVSFDWEEPSKVIRLAIDQNRARVLGISTQELRSS
jgi:multidrug efflux pump